MKRNDLLTNESFSPSRITQKFACAENRIKYHNRKANNLRHSIMFINTPLQKNIRILNDLMIGKEKATYHKQFLLGKGYTFEVMTHFTDYGEKRVACVYQFAIQIVENESVTFIKLKKA